MKKIVSVGLILFFGLLAVSLAYAQAVVTLTPGSSHNSILQGTAEHRYSVTVPAGRLIAFTESNIDTVMRIYNAQGNEIAYDDDSGDQLNARINIQVAAGTYTIGVTGWSSHDVGPYTLHVRTEQMVITPITPGSPHRATLQGADEQHYSITIDWAMLTVYTESDLDTVISIIDQWGEHVAWDDDSGDGLNAWIEHPVQPGTYTIIVHGWSSYDTGPYTLHVLVR